MSAQEEEPWAGIRLGRAKPCTTPPGAQPPGPWGDIAVNLHTDMDGPRGVNVTLASGLVAYLLRTQELGAVEGAEGSLTLNPALRPVLEALHHVLAGGEVEVYVLRRGNPDLVAELDYRAAHATQEANVLSKAAGSSLTATV